MPQAFDLQMTDTEATRPSSVTQISETARRQSPETSNNMPPSPRSLRSIRSLEETRLSVIEEDGGAHVSGTSAPASALPHSTHRPFARRWKDAPPRASSDLKPPEYSTFDESGQKFDRLTELRNKPAVTRRGGWKRLLLIIIFLVVILAIALGVGLGVGLRNRRQANGTSNSGHPAPANDSNSGFPSGRYAVRAFLDTVDTSCTSNAATFRCYPYSVFSTGASQSAVSFNWIITGSASNYMISSSDNPFSITFDNVSLALQDEGANSERYVFSLKMNKVVVPSSPLADDNSAAECFFNGTTLSAALYTKRNASNLADEGSGSGKSGWQAWPFAVEVNQTIAGGNDIPTCYEITNGVQGLPIASNLTTQPSSSQCGCFWRNFDL